ncbi:aminopeptidase [Alishewanella longhuensis]|uniref:Aminopeptidase n=1 Tax=Alishewanella longhuensis TaxID=1091037 RepID=A0ABQ3KTN6_9ALTE|nr:M20/M25/M40 family metallo-hydrolase [Alishewanella longhuensis]GHG59567.1 aminopeptidase [Alishewanella longhuensis]
MLLKKKRFVIPALLLILIALAYSMLKPFWLAQLTELEAERIRLITPNSVAPATLNRINSEQMMADLRWLADAERQGRAPGTPGGIAAREWIAEQFAAIGLEPAGTAGFLHPYSVTEHFSLGRWLRGKNATIPGVENAANVLGLLPGTTPDLKPLVITAHYDHLGMHGDSIFYGADDNASGVAAMLELARYLKAKPLQHPVLFIALDSEEKGLQGAVALFRTGLLQPEQLSFNINIDMLSRDTHQLLFAVGTYHHPWLLPLIDQLQPQSAVKLIPAHDRPWYLAGNTQDWTLSSDHGVFHQQGVPFIYFGVADHADYHTPNDTADKVDVEFYHQVVETVLSFLQILDQQLTAN